MTIVLRMEGITKRFPRVLANDNISIELKKGEIQALLGENGAGKSTLMNCLYGIYPQDEGSIYINEEKISLKSSEDAIKHGIGMVHQHFMLIPQLSVTENIILGLKSNREPFLDLNQAGKEIRKLSDKYGFNIDPNALIKNLPVGAQQRVEILKVLYRKANILILDEATAVLTPQEVKELFKVIRQLAEEGKSVIMIVHKLEEVMEICETVSTLRDGKLVAKVNVADTNLKELAHMMVGREVNLDRKKSTFQPKETVLSVRELVVRDKHGNKIVDGVSFDIRKGEIFGIAGVDGNGQIELSEVITGLEKYKSGSILVNGKSVAPHNARSFINKKVSHIPQDRQKTGLVMEFNIKENLILHQFGEEPFSKFGVLNQKNIQKHAENMIQKYTIRTAGADVETDKLSGGNQQKVVLAREINKAPDVLIAVQPTRGLDIGATEFVRNQILEQRDRGAGVLLVSTELDEILALSDTIAVMHKGSFVGIVKPSEVTIEEIGLMMAGVKPAHSD